RARAAALPPGARVVVITFAQHAGVRFSGTADELRRKGRWNGNVEDERRWTNIEGALQRAYEQLEQQRAGSRRVVLLSDGLPNYGETDPGRLAALARQAADRELHTDVIGIGAGADYGLLERLAPTGMTEHVASRATAAEAMKQITARFAAYGRHVVAGSGELSLEINPHFQVLGVYQLDPVRRRLDGVLSDGGGRRPSEVRLALGAIGEGLEGQPRYALRIRAPERVSAGPIPVLKATGRIGSGAGARALEPGSLSLPTVNNPLAQNIRPDYEREVAAVDLEREISRLADAAGSRAERERIFEEGAERARRIPDPDLAAVFQQSAGGLREGMQEKDVMNESRATSSRSSTRNKSDWFQPIPVEMPDEIRARRRTRSLDDDEDDTGGAYGGYRAYGATGSYGGSGSGTGSGADGPDAPTQPPSFRRGAS
ncbi:VWA domain-containing protein, partial [Streptomyces sp. NPDC058964]|uniref:VWA domain-containing protein n=1 Tax=Streptomyces sp. NPDC058964 TaxID=3346681 RepID=UPI0036794E77